MENLKKFLILVLILVAGLGRIAGAEEPVPEPAPEPVPEPITINLTIRSGATIFFDDLVELLPAGTTEIEGHSLDANSVLSTLNKADLADDSWRVSDLQYFESFESFLLNCIESSVGNDCYDWHYAVDGFTPAEGMDKNILSGGENVYLYFSPQNRISLSASSINTTESVTAIVERYNFEGDSWDRETEATVGITQPDTENPYNPPIEILTSSVDDNGQATFSNIPEGSYDVGIRDDYGYYFPTSPLTVTAFSEPTTSSGSYSSGGGSKNKKTVEPTVTEIKLNFDLKKAFEFLLAQQQENGSFEEELYTDWAAIALSTGNYQNQTIKLIKYLGENKIAGTLLTDFERHAMSLMSLGLNPYNTNGENYIEKIVSSFDGKQFGDIKEDNDDIFALIVLSNAGYTAEDNLVRSAINFVLERQKENGSWDESVDMTGAGIQALANFSSLPEVKESLDKAKEFLKQSQKEDGSWDNNASSTAWVVQALYSLGENGADWKNKTASPLDYLAKEQDVDGGIKDTNIKNRIWKTSYVLGALSTKSWNQLMQKYAKQENKVLPPAPKTETKKVVKIKAPETTTIQNTATVINAVNAETPETPEKSNQKSWLMILLGNVFNFF